MNAMQEAEEAMKEARALAIDFIYKNRNKMNKREMAQELGMNWRQVDWLWQCGRKMYGWKEMKQTHYRGKKLKT